MTPDRSSGSLDKEAGLARRFDEHLRRQARVRDGDRLLVAFSGGMDSLVLLHLLRFASRGRGFDVRAAHFDHGMRADSEAEARWVRGICRAWEVPLRMARADPVPATEEQAREARYDFLLSAFRQDQARWLLTAHHGDDQAETVLFRALRGTGLKGLAGIPSVRSPGLYRPLLPFSRMEIQDYSVAHGLRPRQDPTNRDLSYARNYLRHEVLPAVEKHVAPRARRALRRLARIARENEEAWRSLLPGLLEGVVERDGGRVFIVRSKLLSYDPAVQSRLLREVLRGAGITLNEAGTRVALEFTRTGTSGRSLDLPGGVRLTRDFDRLVVGGEGERAQGGRMPLSVAGPQEGSGTAVIGGRSFQVVWGPKKPGGCDVILGAKVRDLSFPLRVRGWVPGDRIRLLYGTKKLKRLFGEARVSADKRSRTPVISDGRGRILWVPGVASSVLVKEGPPDFFLGIRDADGS